MRAVSAALFFNFKTMHICARVLEDFNSLHTSYIVLDRGWFDKTVFILEGGQKFTVNNPVELKPNRYTYRVSDIHHTNFIRLSCGYALHPITMDTTKLIVADITRVGNIVYDFEKDKPSTHIQLLEGIPYTEEDLVPDQYLNFWQ